MKLDLSDYEICPMYSKSDISVSIFYEVYGMHMIHESCNPSDSAFSLSLSSASVSTSVVAANITASTARSISVIWTTLPHPDIPDILPSTWSMQGLKCVVGAGTHFWRSPILIGEKSDMISQTDHTSRHCLFQNKGRISG